VLNNPDKIAIQYVPTSFHYAALADSSILCMHTMVVFWSVYGSASEL